MWELRCYKTSGVSARSLLKETEGCSEVVWNKLGGALDTVSTPYILSEGFLDSTGDAMMK
jgi:hypothetical protein